MPAPDYANALQRSSPLTKSTQRRRGCTLRPRTLALALSGAFALGALAQTLPTGGVAIHGQAQITQTAPNQLLVTTGNGAGTRHSAIDWQSFSLSAGASARFVQPDAASLSINRVATQTPSTLLGTLSSNGRLVLVNPSGITVGAGAVVDTAGFTASALRMTDADALAGRLRFGAATPGPGTGAGLTVDGRITARDGDVVLIAPQIGIGTNALLQSANGSTILAAGQQVEITGRGLEGISLLVQAREDMARNLGRLEGDAVAIFAGTLQHSGAIQASSATLEGGKVVLRAAGDAVVDGGSVLANGRLGGSIDLLGQRVGVTGQALVDASGEQAGGSIRIGGDFQGKNAALPNAERTFLGPETTVRADARSTGDGGRIIVWSDGQTQSWGNISARGGESSGNGGFVEVSGKHTLAFESVVDTRAPHGLTGTLLLDPDDIWITLTGNPYGAPVLFGDPPMGAPLALSPSTIGASLSNVVLQANNSLDFSAAVTMTTNGVGISARAGGTLTVNAPITTRGGAVTLIGGDPGALSGPSDGAVYVSYAIDTTGGGAVPAGANVTLQSYKSDIGGSSVSVSGNVNAGSNGVLTLDAPNDRIDLAAGTLLSGKNINLNAANGMGLAGAIAASGDLTISTSTAGYTVTVLDTISAAGTMTLTLAGNLELVADTISAQLLSTGNQNISAHGILLQGGGGQDTQANIVGQTNQSITVGDDGLTLKGGGGAQRGNSASIAHDGNSATNQTITVNGAGFISLEGGSSSIMGASEGSRASIRSDQGNSQTIAFTGSGAGRTITLTGGTVGSDNYAEIYTGSGTQFISGASTITLTGGTSGGTVSDAVDLHGNAAAIEAKFGWQTIGANEIVLQGGASGINNLAGIIAGRTQQINIGVGGLTLIGGGGGSSDRKNAATIWHTADTAGTIQTITVAGGGNVTLQGGTAAATNVGWDPNIGGLPNGAVALIRGDGVAQTINFTGAGSTINATAGSVGSNNLAGIEASNGTQMIQGSVPANAPAINLTGGSGGVAGEPNGAHIRAQGQQTLSTKSVSLSGGSGIDSYATIVAPIQSLAIDGNLSLSGGSGGGTNPGTRIGGASNTGTNLTLTVTGNATLAAGSSAGAGLGVSPTASGHSNAITATIAGTLTMTPSAGAGTRIGSRASDVQGGTITLTAGNMVFDVGDGASNVAAIRTLDNVTLNTTTAGITEAADTVIRANQLTVNAKGPVLMDSLGNQATSLQATITGADAGDLFYTSAPGSLLTLAGLNMTGSKTARVSADDLAITGSVSNSGGSVILRPQALARAVQIEATPTAGVLSLQPAELGSVSAATLEIGRLDGSGDLSVLSSLGSAQIGAGTLRLLSGANVWIGTGVGIGNGSTAFDHALDVRAANDLTMADNSGIYLADNRALALRADNDASGAGAVAMSDVAIKVGTSSGNTSGNLSVQGTSVTVQPSAGIGTLISVAGSGAQTFTATVGDLNFRNANGSNGSLVVSTVDGSQTLNAAGQVLVQAGIGNGTFTNVISGGSQSISANGMSILAGSSNSTSGNYALVRSAGSQSVTLDSGGLQLTAGSGTGTTDHFAMIYQAGGAGTSQAITLNNGGSLTMQGGSSTLTNVGGAGHGSRALIEADGDSQQVSLAGGGNIELTGGSAGSRAYALIYAKNGTQSVSGASGITLNGGSGGGIAGEGNTAGLTTDLGSQSIDTSGIWLYGGAAGTENLAQIRQGLNANAGTQTVTIRNGGTIDLHGGGGTTNLARIQSFGASQTLDFTAGGSITMQGGSGASNDFARIQAVSGNQTIQGGPAITISGGASGGADLAGNSADIRASLAGATQTIHASSITLNAGASGQENYAYIGAGTQVIDVLGDLALTGGGSAPSADGTSGGGARIGAPGTAATNLTLTVGGDLILTGGTAATAGVAIGNGRLNSANTTISITAGGDIRLNPGSSTSAGGYIGSSASATGGGDIDLTAGGLITLGGTVTGELAIRTLGNVSLDADDLSIGNLVAGAHVTGVAANAITLGGVGKFQAGAVSGDAIVLATGGGFGNGAGALALQVNAPARWLVYSQDPAQDMRGGLLADFKQYGKAYGDSTALAGSGNGFVYAITPSASVGLTGVVSKVYDGTDTATLSAANFLASGAIDGDVFTFSGQASGHYDTRNVGSGKTVSVSGLSISAMDGSTPVYGYAIAGGSASGPVGTITAAPLTVSTASVSKTYDASTNAPGAAPLITLGTLAAGDTLIGGSFAFLDANAGNGKTVTVSGVTVSDGNGGNNYTLTLLDNTTSSITQRALSTWTGGAGDHLWSSPGNWDALPSASNVLAVSIPSGAGTVALDIPVVLQGINSGSPLSQVAGGSLHSSALSLVTQGGANLSGSGNQIAQLSATNSGGGNITLANGVPLVLGSVQNSSGDITVSNTGAVSSNGPVVASGNVALTALSPLTVGAPGVSAGGNVVLTAGNLSAPGPTDNLTLNGPVTAGNTVGLYAGNNLMQNAAVFGANGVTAQALGSFSFGPLATTNAPPISYSAGGVPVAPPPTVLASSLQAPGDVVANALGVMQDVLADVQGDDALAFNPDGSKKKKIADGVVAEEEVCR